MTRLSASVIVPCHNDGAFLAEALESALSQSRTPDEIIVVDDGSTDESRDVAEGFAGRIRIVAQTHQGIGSARNTGLRLAGGTVIAFLDADDVWPRSSLEVRISRLEAQPQLAASIGRTEEFLTPGFDADRLAARVGRPPMIVRLAGAMAIRRDVFDRLGGFDETLSVGEWLDWTDRFNQAGFTCAVVPEITLRRRIHPANCSSGVPPAWGDYLKVLRAALHRRHA